MSKELEPIMEQDASVLTRSYIILGALFSHNNCLDIYLSVDYPSKMISKNIIIRKYVGFISRFYKKYCMIPSEEQVKSFIAMVTNVDESIIEESNKSSIYFTVWEKSLEEYSIWADKSPDNITDRFKVELEELTNTYILEETQTATAYYYKFITKGCMGTECDSPCELHKHCKKLRENDNLNMYDYSKNLYDSKIQELLKLKDESRGSMVLSYDSNLTERKDMYKTEYEFRKAGNLTLGVSTGIKSIDRLTDGLCKSQTIGIFARSGVGKSALCLQMALDAWTNSNVNILYINLELPVTEIQKRLDSCLTGVSYNRILKGVWETEKELEDFLELLEEKKQQKQNEFVIMDESYFTINRLKATFKEYHGKWGENFVVFLDNINRMSLPSSKPEWQGLKEVGKEFHIWTKHYNCSGVLVGQLNREARSVKTIGKADGNILSGSDSIINDLSAAFMIADMNGRECKKIIPLKGRNFSMDETIVLKNNLWRMRMEED